MALFSVIEYAPLAINLNDGFEPRIVVVHGHNSQEQLRTDPTEAYNTECTMPHPPNAIDASQEARLEERPDAAVERSCKCNNRDCMAITTFVSWAKSTDEMRKVFRFFHRSSFEDFVGGWVSHFWLDFLNYYEYDGEVQQCVSYENVQAVNCRIDVIE